MVLRYTHVHGTHIDKAIAALGRTVPEQTVTKDAGTTTQGLHKRFSVVASPKSK
jgi:hypothetical protein